MKYGVFKISISHLRNGSFGYAILRNGAYKSFGNDIQYSSKDNAIEAAKDEIDLCPDYLWDKKRTNPCGGL